MDTDPYLIMTARHLNILYINTTAKNSKPIPNIKKCLLGPLHEAREVPLGLDVLANAEISRSLLEQRVDDSLRLQLLDGERGRGHLLTDLAALKKSPNNEDLYQTRLL